MRPTTRRICLMLRARCRCQPMTLPLVLECQTMLPTTKRRKLFIWARAPGRMCHQQYGATQWVETPPLSPGWAIAVKNLKAESPHHSMTSAPQAGQHNGLGSCTGSGAKIVKLEHAWRRLDGRNDDGYQVAPFPGRDDPVGGALVFSLAHQPSLARGNRGRTPQAGP